MMICFHLKNFKSHQDTRLSLASLNVFTGLNGTGKSSVFQALLLLRQSFLKNNLLQHGLDLNGDLFSVGVTEEAVYQWAQDPVIELELGLDNLSTLRWRFAYQSPGDTFMPLQPPIETAELTHFSLFNPHFQYLSAEHLPPQLIYPQNTYQVQTAHQISDKRGQGELVAHFLHHFGENLKLNIDTLRHPNCQLGELRWQTDAWLSEMMSTKLQVLVTKRPGYYELRYQFQETDLATPALNAINVSFGASYVLPVIVAVLAAQPGDVILIENPESHLHPHAQSKLAELCALAAQAGIQIFLETHSDHIINGILVATRKYWREQPGISHRQVKIYYFQRPNHQSATEVIEVPVSEEGRIKYPPPGFFDQFKKDIKTLMGF